MAGPRYPFLDALRGIAALLVAWQHCAQRIPERWPDAPADGAVLGALAEWLNFGSMGVVTFFLISGFVIPSSLGAAHSGAPGVLKAFAVRRFFRLYPAFWLSVAQAVALGIAVAGAFPPTATLLANLTMASGFFGEPHLQGMYWTLQMELVFYALCVLLFRLGRLHDGETLRNLSLASTAVFLALWIPLHQGVLRVADTAFVMLPFMLALMLIGSLCRKVHDAGGGLSLSAWTRGEDARRLWTAALPWLAFPVLMIALSPERDALIYGDPVLFGTGHLSGVALFAAGMIWLRKRPSRVLVYLGLVSYSIYLFHGVAIDMVVWAVEDSGLEILRGRGFRFYLGSMLLLTVAVASVVYFCVEKPSIALGCRLSKRFVPR